MAEVGRNGLGKGGNMDGLNVGDGVDGMMVNEMDGDG